MPRPQVDSPEVAFVQAARFSVYEKQGVFEAGRVLRPWHIDNQPGAPQGWFGYYMPDITDAGLQRARVSGPLALGINFILPILRGTTGMPDYLTVAPSCQGGIGVLVDRPSPVDPRLGRESGFNRKQEFITCAVIRSGPAAGTVYGCVTWGQVIDAAGNWRLIEPKFFNWPTDEISQISNLRYQEMLGAIEDWNADPNTISLPKLK